MKIHEIFFSYFFFQISVVFFSRGVMKGSKKNMKVRYFVSQSKISNSENGFSSKMNSKKIKNISHFFLQ